MFNLLYFIVSKTVHLRYSLFIIDLSQSDLPSSRTDQLDGRRRTNSLHTDLNEANDPNNPNQQTQPKPKNAQNVHSKVQNSRSLNTPPHQRGQNHPQMGPNNSGPNGSRGPPGPNPRQRNDPKQTGAANQPNNKLNQTEIRKQNQGQKNGPTSGSTGRKQPPLPTGATGPGGQSSKNQPPSVTPPKNMPYTKNDLKSEKPTEQKSKSHPHEGPRPLPRGSSLDDPKSGAPSPKSRTSQVRSSSQS